MKLYDETLTGAFLYRPNRFIAHVQTENGLEICHVKNTGRCTELLTPGAEVTLAVGKNPGRKTRCDLVAVQKGGLYINMDSQAPNKAAAECLPRLFPGVLRIRPEAVFGDSRLDFFLETEKGGMYVEVKGVTLEKAGTALFPDAPTDRGIKHLRELEKCVAAGFGAALLLVIQMKGPVRFRPNWETHAAFGEALLHARDAGVQVLAYDCAVTPDSMTVDQPVPIDWAEKTALARSAKP